MGEFEPSISLCLLADNDKPKSKRTSHTSESALTAPLLYTYSKLQMRQENKQKEKTLIELQS